MVNSFILAAKFLVFFTADELVASLDAKIAKHFLSKHKIVDIDVANSLNKSYKSSKKLY